MHLEWLSRLRLRCRALVHRRRLNRDLEDELRFHLETRAEKYQHSPASLAPAVRKALHEADSRSRFTGWLMAIFAGSALLLAMIGIYGVMSYSVTRRTQEIGVRMALGAQGLDVLRMVVGGGMGLVALGLVLGIAAALALTHLIGTLLYGVKPGDPLTFGAAALALGSVGLAACLIPALRATRIAPASALRDE